MGDHWKADEQYFTVVLFNVFQFYPVCNFGNVGLNKIYTFTEASFFFELLHCNVTVSDHTFHL